MLESRCFIMDIASIVLAIVLGVVQIYLAKSMKDFQKRQDDRDESRRKESVYAEATRFIQKYSKGGYESEILLLPFCVSAYKYNNAYPYRRDIYREFCSLTEDIQNEILTRQGLALHSYKVDDFYKQILCKIESNNKISYPNDKNANSQFFHEGGKYFYRALKHHGESLISTNLRCLQDHLTNLLAYHKDEKPLSDLTPYFEKSEIEACYICCGIAKYTAIYNCEDIEIDLGHAADYSGKLYMEDLFLDALHTVENYNIQKETK